MFCPNCGTQLSEDSRFCASCGTPMPDTLAQQDPVPQESPVTPEVTADPIRPEAPKKKSKRPIILIATLVLALAAVWMLFFSKKTVYLVTYSESISYSYGNGGTRKTILEYEYDDLGRVLSYSSLTKVSGDYASESGFEIEYEYAENGLLAAARGETGGEDVEYEYFYDDGVLEKVVAEFDNGTKGKATCDRQGRIVSMKFYDQQGEATVEYSYEYDKNGDLAEKIVESGSYYSEMIFENRALVEQITRYEGQITSRSVFSWDEDGRMTEYSQYNGDGELYMSMEFEYTFKGKKLMELVITASDDTGEVGEIVGVAEWDGLTGTMELTGESADGEEIPEDTYFELEYDKHGNLLSYRVYMGDLLMMEQTNEYQKVRVPRDYEKFWAADPIWMVNG